MKNFVLLLILSLWGASAMAAATGEASRPVSRTSIFTPPAFRFTLYFFNPDFRYERDSDLDLGFHQSLGFGLGGRWKNFAAVLETSSIVYKTGNQALSIDREHRDYILSGRYFFWNRQFANPTGSDIGFYVAGGVGYYTEDIRTSLLGATTQDNGNREALGTAGLGTEGFFNLVSGLGLTMGVEIRILASKSFDPNPEPSGILRLGLSY